MDPLTEIFLVAFLSTALSIAAMRVRLLTPSGSVAALAVGIILGIFGSLYWLMTVVAFALIGFLVTKSGFSEKRKRGLQEGKTGERSGRNVMGIALPGCIFALMNAFSDGNYHFLMSVGFIATIAVAAADTVASELGTRDEDVWMITTMKKVPPGTDGGISVFGTAVSFVGSVAAVLIGWVVIFGSAFDPLVLIPVAAGFVGCLMDSLLGATWETEGRISKYTNNMLTGLMGGIMTVIFVGLLT